MADRDTRALWRSFSSALGTELRDAPIIRGVSGLDHPVQAVCVDDKNKRVIVFSAEPNPRIAALMQADIQATMADVSVLVARPIAIDLGVIVRGIFPDSASANFTLSLLTARMKRFERMKEAKRNQLFSAALDKTAGPAIRALTKVPLPTMAQFVGVLQQAAHFDWPSILDQLRKADREKPISLKQLHEIDNLAVDRAHGVCPIPLYEFTDKDWDLFLSHDRKDEIQDRLKSLGIFQYFFPPPDQVALGLAERGVRTKDEIVEVIRSAPGAGHPLAPSELVPDPTNIPDLIDLLRERGYVAEVDQDIEITPAGTSARMAIRMRPRESLISKLINRITIKADVKIDAKDIF